MVIPWSLCKPIQALHFRSYIQLSHIPNQVRCRYYINEVAADTLIVLSLAISPSKDHYITAAADAIIAKHPLPAGKPIWKAELKPLKISQTKHSGQQGLHYRSDGKIFATAGWDAHVRVYSGKTMKEVAVLKWHKLGCYATNFAAVQSADTDVLTKDLDNEGPDGTRELVVSNSTVNTVQQRRHEKAQTIHWLAVGSKDGKVSLWDIY